MVEPQTGSVIIITDAPGSYTRDMCYDGKSLWAVDYQDDKLYQLKIRDGEKLRRYNSHTAKVTYQHELFNFGPGNVIDADVHIAIPTDRPSQNIIETPAFKPKGQKFVTDKWGQRTAHFHYENIPSGVKERSEMVVTAKIHEVRYFIYPEDVGKMQDIPNDIRERYLENMRNINMIIRLFRML